MNNRVVIYFMKRFLCSHQFTVFRQNFFEYRTKQLIFTHATADKEQQMLGMHGDLTN